MRLLRTFPMAAFASVLLSIVGICIAQRSVGLLLVCGVLAALSWYVTEGPRSRSLPGWTANVLITAVALNAVVDLAGHLHGLIGVLGRFLVWLTLIKLYQRKRAHDYRQLLGLSLLLMLIGCLQSSDLLFGACLLAYSVLGVYVLLLFQLYAAYEQSRAARLQAVPSGYRLVTSLAPIVGRRAALQFRTLMAGIGVAGFLMSAILFLLFPRNVGEGLVGTAMRDWGRDRVTRYTDEVNLTSGTRITESRRVVLKVRLSEAPPGTDQMLRLRGAVLERYEGDGRWTASQRNDRMIEARPPGFTALLPFDDAPTVTQHVEMLSRGETLFSIPVPVAILTRQARPIKFDPRTLTLHDVGGGTLQHYTIKAVPDPAAAKLVQLAESDPQRLTRQFADFDPRVAAQARSILAADKIPALPPDDPAGRWRWNAEAAAALTRHFHGGRYEYVTDLSDVRLADTPTGTQDPIVGFLFVTRRGHCEYFASGLAAMCNCLGIPARLVTGYVALERDRETRTYIVRESNAHAWVEVQVGPAQWQTFDPTSGATLRRIQGTGGTLSDRWKWQMDRFEATWLNTFVAFDRHAQARLIDSLDFGWSVWVTDAADAVRRWLARVNRAFYMGPAGYIWMGIVALALSVGAVALGMRLHRSAQLRRTLHLKHVGGPASQRMLRQLGFYMDMLGRLEQCGLPKPPWQPPLQFAGALRRTDPDRAAIVRRVTRLFYAARYGGRRLSRQEIADAEAQVEKLKNS